MNKKERIELLAYGYVADQITGFNNRVERDEYDRRFRNIIEEAFEIQEVKCPDTFIEKVKSELDLLLNSMLDSSKSLADSYILRQDAAVSNKINSIISNKRSRVDFCTFKLFHELTKEIITESILP